jgi:hypothetical protein
VNLITRGTLVVLGLMGMLTAPAADHPRALFGLGVLVATSLVSEICEAIERTRK